jgi:subtilisin-like proprotein convertase family protein
MSIRRSLNRNQIRPRFEQLEFRQMLAADLLPTENKPSLDSFAADVHFYAGQELVQLHTHPTRVAIGTKSSTSPTLPRELSFVRDVAAGVRVYESTVPLSSEWIASIESIENVTFATSVFVNAKSSSEAVLLNEIIVALKPDVSAVEFFGQHDEFSAYRPLDGTPDQFIATVTSGYGSSALQVGNEIAEAPGVAWMSPNFYQSWEKFYFPNDPLFGNQWHLHNTGQGAGTIDADSDLPEAWDLVPGGSSSLVVGVIDDGVESTHPDLNIWTNTGEVAGDGIDNDGNGWVDDIRGWNFVLNTNNSEPVGADRHGTAVAGVATAKGDNGVGVTGAAYLAKVMSLKMFDGNLVASDANIAAALYYAGGRTRSGTGTWRAADLVNNSWGGGATSAAINAALTWGTTLGREGQGATYFFSSGNGFAASVSEPAVQAGSIPGVIAVGATNNRAERSNYSNYGPQLDFVAPSNDSRAGYLAIETTDRVGGNGYAAGDYTGTGATGFGGTSSAAPLATGIGALVLSRAQSESVPLSPTQLRSYLRNATDLFGSFSFDINTGKNIEVGYGRLNASTAVRGVGVPEISVVSTLSEVLSGSTINLGSANLGKTTSVSLRIRNQGTQPLTISATSVAAPFSIAPGLIGTSIGLGESRLLTLLFSPLTPGTHNAPATIASNDTDESSFVLNLTGLAINTAVSGNIYEDFAGDGVRAPSDTNVLSSGALVYVDANSNGSFDTGETNTPVDATGYYAFLTLPNGTHQIRPSLPGWFQNGPTGGFYSITITSPLDFNLNQDFGFSRNGRMYARGFNDVNFNGTVDTGETGVPGQLIYIDANRNRVYEPALVVSNVVPVSVPDLSTAISTLSVTESRIITDVNVTVNIVHTWMGDMVLTLIGPLGQRVLLASAVGGSADGYINTIFDDQAAIAITAGTFPFTGSFRPSGLLSTLNGTQAMGLWRLEVVDNVGGDSGTINSWSLSFFGTDTGRYTNDEGFVAIDLPNGSSQVPLEPVGSWEFTLPSDGIQQVPRTAGPVRGVDYGLIFGNFAPTALALAPAAVDENMPAGTLVGAFSTTDPNRTDTFTYSLVSGTGSDDNTSFQVVGNQLVTAVSFDYEVQNTRSVRVRTTDSGGLTFESAFVISINNVNEAGTGITLTSNTLPENELPGYFVGLLVSNDPDTGDSILFQFSNASAAMDNGLFKIQGDRLESAVTLDYEARSSYSIRVRATDRAGLTIEQDLTIRVTNVNEKPFDILLTNSSILENSALGTVIGTFRTFDVDLGDTHTISMASGVGADDNSKFEWVGAELRVKTLLDFETQRLHSIRVRSTDLNGLWLEKVFPITIINVNESPTNVTLSPSSVNEGLAIGTTVGVIAAIDPDVPDIHKFELFATATYPDNDKFRVVGNQLRTSAIFNFNVKNQYSIGVQAIDQGGLTFVKNLIVTINDVNDPPTDIGLDNRSIPENQLASSPIGNFSTFDPDGGDAFTYSLVSGSGATDNASFVIVGSQLRSATSFDFEAKASYSIRVESKDSAGVGVQKSFLIDVTNVNEAPTSIALSNNAFDENGPVGTSIGLLSTQDPDVSDTFIFSFATGSGDQDNGKFRIVGNTLQSHVVADFEQTSSFSILVKSTDAAGLSTQRQFAIAVRDLNEEPFGLVISSNLVENTPSGVPVGTAIATDVDLNDVLTYSLAAGTGSSDNSLFSITPQGVLRHLQPLDFETKSSYSIRVRATDNGGLFVENSAVLAVIDQNEEPTQVVLSASSLSENLGANATVGWLSTVDQDAFDTFTYSFVTGVGSTDNAAFFIVGNGLQAAANFDFETKNTYSVRIRSTDAGGLFNEQFFAISVKDENEAPTLVSLSNSSVLENAPAGTLVGFAITSDVDAGDSFTYSLVSGVGSGDNGAFAIVNNRLETTLAFDFETKSIYTVRLQSIDRGGLSTESPFVIQVLDANDLPTSLNLSSTQVNENVTVGFLIGLLSSTDQDVSDTVTYRFVAGINDNASFLLDGANGQELRVATSPNFESKSSYRIDIQAIDTSASGPIQSFTIAVNDLNEAPTQIALSASSLAENLGPNAVVGLLGTIDQDAEDTFTYSLATGDGATDNSAFTIVANSLRTVANFDFETQSTYSVRIRSTDAGGLFSEQFFAISVTDVNEAPTLVSLINNSVFENAPAGTLVGVATTSDVDAGDSFSYSLVAGVGSEGNSAFAIVNNRLETTFVLDFETQSSYSIRLRTTDRGGLSTESPIVIQVLDANDLPTNLSLSSTQVNENVAIGALIGLLNSTDQDASDSVTYRFVSGNNDNATFLLGGATGQELLILASPNFELRSSYQIDVQAIDKSASGPIKSFVISVNDLNEAPTRLLLSNSTVSENNPTGTQIGLFSAEDQDIGDSHEFQLVHGAGIADNHQFTIVGNELRLAESADFERQASYTVRILGVDARGLALETNFVITVLDQPESPTNLQLSNNRIAENRGPLALVGSLDAFDPDAGDLLSYSLVSGPGSTDNAIFELDRANLMAKNSLDFEVKNSYSVRVRVTDRTGLFVEEPFTLAVDNVPEAPTAIAASNTSIAENLPAGTPIGTLSTTDADFGETFSYSLAPTTTSGDNAKFQIVGNELRSNAKYNFEAKSSYQLLVRSTDSAGLFVEVPFVIQVTDVVELPINAQPDNATTTTNLAVLINVLGNDVDPDGFIDVSTVTIVSPPSQGSVRVLEDGRIEFTPPQDSRSNYSFSYSVRDNDDVVSNTSSVNVKVYSAFQNQRWTLDVDADGSITPLDVLTVINDINVNGIRTLPTGVPDTAPYIDTNGNGQSDPLDVLEVVNYLNSLGGGEGESRRTKSDANWADVAFANTDFASPLGPRDRASENELAAAAMVAIDEYHRDLAIGKNRRR